MHGGFLPSVRAKAEREYLATLRGDRGFISEWQKAELVRSWERAQARHAARFAKKYGRSPEGTKSTKPPPVRPQKPVRDEQSDPFYYEGWN